MAQRGGSLHALAKAQREAERQRKAQERAQTKAVREAERTQKAYERAFQADAKEQARLYAEARAAEVAQLNEELESNIARLSSLLVETLSVDDYFDLENLKKTPTLPTFQPGALATPEPLPQWSDYAPPAPSTLKKFIPWVQGRYDKEVAEARMRFDVAVEAHNEREAQRRVRLQAARDEFGRQIDAALAEAEAHNAEIDQFQQDFAAGSPEAVVNYFALVLEASSYPPEFPQHAKLAYVPESKQLVVEFDLPPFDVIPTVAAYKYVKSRDAVTETARPLTKRRALYSSVVAQIALRTLHELFEADRSSHLESIVFNGYVDSIDPGTGRPVRTCVATVRTTQDAFEQLELSRVGVDPVWWTGR